MRDQPGRRAILGYAAFAGIAPGLVWAGAAAAEPNTAKADVKYQVTPKGSDSCNACVSFLSGDAGGGPGTCKVVQGPIPQNGWCVLFSRRRS